MSAIGEQAYRDFPRWVVDAVVRIYDQRTGFYDKVDREAVAKILDQFPDASEEAKSNLRFFAAMPTR
jgi:hypothetical protein